MSESLAKTINKRRQPIMDFSNIIKPIVFNVPKEPLFKLVVLSKDGVIEEFDSRDEIFDFAFDTDAQDLARTAWSELDIPKKNKADERMFRDFFNEYLEEFLFDAGMEIKLNKSLPIDSDLPTCHEDEGQFRTYAVITQGYNVLEAIEGAIIFEIDQDGGELDSYELGDADSEVYKDADKLIRSKFRQLGVL